MNNSNIRMQVLCALFAAFCAVCSQLTIPIQPVPITLGTFAVLLAGGFLGSRYGLMSIVIYLLLGAAGVPVFSMMRSGVSVIACLMGQALQSSPMPQPLFRELTQLSSSPTLLGCPESSVSVIA